MPETDHSPHADGQHDNTINREQAPAQAAKPDPLVGQYLTQDYLILDRLGAGGMAIVYKAKHLKTDRIVAVKTLRERDPAIMERFYREVQTLSKLKHKNIVEALDCIRTDAHHTFLVMEYVEGITLETLVRSQGRVEKAVDIAAILSQVCDALDHAHQQRIIHRDLKPANIVMMVDETSSAVTVKVLDFGIAKLQDDLQKLTSEGQALGSPLYMSPEQCMGLEITPASDVYSLGILSYQLITGELPYKSNKMLEIMSAHCNPDKWPQPISELRPDLPHVAQLNQVIFHALNTKLDARFQTVAEFGKAISMWIQPTIGGDANAQPLIVKPAKAVTTALFDQKETIAIRNIGVRTQNNKTTAKVNLPQKTVVVLKVALFLILAIAMTGGLSYFLLNNRQSINANGFLEASRFVSNLFAPVKPKENAEQTKPADSQSEQQLQQPPTDAGNPGTTGNEAPLATPPSESDIMQPTRGGNARKL